jgi:hypothetical protein
MYAPPHFWRRLSADYPSTPLADVEREGHSVPKGGGARARAPRYLNSTPLDRSPFSSAGAPPPVCFPRTPVAQNSPL